MSRDRIYKNHDLKTKQTQVGCVMYNCIFVYLLIFVRGWGEIERYFIEFIKKS